MTCKYPFVCISGVMLALGAVHEAPAQCEQIWTGFSGGNIPQTVRALVYTNDLGPDPLLIVGGTFFEAGGVACNKIAKWDGASFSAFENGGANNDVECCAIYDQDGDGPLPQELIVGGSFTNIGGVAANYIGRWDGTTWSPLGSGAAPGSGGVSCLAVFDEDGAGSNGPSLFAGGSFSSIGGVSTFGFARWSGTSWSSVGGGLNTAAAALTVHDDGSGPALYVGGSFTSAGGVPVNRIARWTGSRWQDVGGGVSGGIPSPGVRAMCSFDADDSGPGPAVLVAGGNFTQAGASGVLNIARWNGTGWSALGSGVAGDVRTMAAHDDDGAGPVSPALYVGGRFQSAGGVASQSIARWSGSSWQSVAGGVSTNENVNALASVDWDDSGPLPTRLIVGGSFNSGGEIQTSCIAQWNGIGWAPLGEGPNSAAVAIVEWDQDGDGPETTNLYVGGYFDTIGGNEVQGIARYDGTQWTALAQGVDGLVSSFGVFDEDGTGANPAVLFVGGGFVSVSGNAFIRKIARWDGASWSAVGTGQGVSGGNVTPEVRSMVNWEDGPAGTEGLYIGGAFEFVDAEPAARVARWTGTEWQALDTGITGPSNTAVNTLVVHDDDGTGPTPSALYACGTFNTAGGVFANGVAKWDGKQWSGLFGLAEFVRDIAAFDSDDEGPLLPSLYADGGQSIRRWNGSVWEDFALFNQAVFALETIDPDGGGPLGTWLLIGGNFTLVNGTLPAQKIVAWDGENWITFGSGLTHTMLHAAAADPDGPGGLATNIYIVGSFQAAGGSPVAGFARWGCQECTCDIAPGNGNATVSVVDLLLVIGHWGAVGASPGDINDDGVVNVNDLLAVVGAWGACP